MLRLRQWLHARPLWLDEAMLSLNILTRDYGELTAPLASDQTAPVPFLWAEKAAAALFGSAEMALRLPALLAGCVLLALCLPLARRLLDPWAAALAVALTALSPALIYYANEVKPYGLDALAGAGMALLTLRLLERPAARQRWAALLAAGLVTAAASTPAPFILAGVGVALLADPRTRAEPAAWRWLPACAVLWAGVFLAEYLTVYRSVAGNGYMQRFWLEFFLDPSVPGIGDRLRAAVSLYFRDLQLGAGGGWREQAALVLVVPWLLGLATLAVRRRAVALLLVLPLLAALLASALRLYPAAPRLLLFAAPAQIILVVAGVARVAEALGPRRRDLLLGIASAGLLVLPLREAWRGWRTPPERESVRQLVRWFLRDHRPGAVAYIPGRTVPAWLYYTTDWRQPDLSRIERLTAAVSSTGPLFYQRPSRGTSVLAEGDEFSFSYRDWQEVIGVPPGRGPDSTGQRRAGTDPGWAENEVRRLASAAAPQLWVIVTTFEISEPYPLGPALAAAGAHESGRLLTPGGIAMRFDPAGLNPTSSDRAPAGPE